MDRPIVGIFDADIIAYYVTWNKLGEGEKTLEDCINKCDDFISNVCKAITCDYFVGFLTKGKCFRYDIYPEYKANRKYGDMPAYMKECKQYLIDTYGFISGEGYEADDLIVSYKKANPQYDCIIISPDKDLLNLEGTHYNPRKGEIVHCNKEQADEYFWLSCMTGDSTDNIKGVKGVGKVNATKIIKEKNIFESLRNVVLEQYCKTYGEREGIRQFYVNYTLLTLVDDVDLKLLDVKLNKIEVLSE